MPANRKVLLDIIAILAIGLIVVVGYKLSPLLQPKADVAAVAEAGCDLHRQPCAAQLPDSGRIELGISPRPIPMVAPFQAEVRVTGIKASKVEIDFAGVDMNMGYNRPALVQAADGSFRGEALLPVCVTGKMAWQATVLVESDTARIAAPFRFNSLPD